MGRPPAIALDGHLLPEPPGRLGVAVSGGSDSMALLHLSAEYGAAHGLTIEAVTVDHGLRPEAAAEAEAVGRACAGLGVGHTVLRWTGWDGKGNLQDMARTARYRLMAGWARDRGIGSIALGHTQDDQAETVLMRLARGSGVDGLAAMAPRRSRDGVTWLRPLLSLRRAALRGYLRQRGIAWSDDPGNADPRFERIRVREALEVLAPLGIEVPALAGLAARMASARDALEHQTHAEARRLVRIDAGAVVIDWPGFDALPEEIARRLIVHALRWIGRGPYAPRHGAVQSLLDALRAGTGGTAEGCHARRSRGAVWIFREYDAVRDLACTPQEPWDGRWRITGPETDGALSVRALGEHGLALCPDWRDTGRPRAVLLGTPAVWSDGRLVAAPLAGHPGPWRAEPAEGADAFFAALLSH